MTALEQLKSILTEKYRSEDGEPFEITLKPGLQDTELEVLAKAYPTEVLPAEYGELLHFASGFEFYGVDEVTFDGLGQFGFEEFFPCSIQLASDGFGNFWILDVSENGILGAVYYICHDPAVVVKHSDSLAQFIQHVNDFGKNGPKSHLDIIHEDTVHTIWTTNTWLNKQSALEGDRTIKDFAAQFPDNFVFADLRNAPLKSGFAWGKFGPDIGNAKRYGSEPLWAIEKKEKKGFFARLFGRK